MANLKYIGKCFVCGKKVTENDLLSGKIRRVALSFRCIGNRSKCADQFCYIPVNTLKEMYNKTITNIK
jgi:hypothetical protein